jgi:hypothetical protein
VASVGNLNSPSLSMISSSKHQQQLKIDPGSSWVKVDGCDRRGISRGECRQPTSPSQQHRAAAAVTAAAAPVASRSVRVRYRADHRRDGATVAASVASVGNPQPESEYVSRSSITSSTAAAAAAAAAAPLASLVL